MLGRLWRIPMAYAIVVALPIQFLVGWIAYQGYVEGEQLLGRNGGFWGIAPPFHHEQWRYFAREAFREDIADLVAPRMPTDDGLETFSLTIANTSLQTLNSDLPESGKDGDSFPALLETGDLKTMVKARYMGDNHWHWLYPQKSWRVKMPGGDPYRDRVTWNLKNAPSRLVIDETLIARLSRERGVLTPDVEPVKFLLNGTYGGLYLRWDTADESLLRRARRMPGSIYEGEYGDLDAEGVSSLFRDQQNWTKGSARNAEQAGNRTDIEALIWAINGPPAGFHEFARLHLDLRAYAAFIAIERLFGGRHHDYNHNHKAYFDPYKGRFEPIQWDFGDWGYDYEQTSFDGTEYPLLTALKQHPEYELRLQRELYDLAAKITPEELGRRLDEVVRSVLPALRADVQRDHADWGVKRDLRLHLVPCVYFGIDEYLEDVENHKRRFSTMHRGVVADLADSGCEVRVVPGDLARLEVASVGHAALQWSGFTAVGSGKLEVFRDLDRDGVLDESDERVAEAELAGAPLRIPLAETLYPGLRKIRKWNGDPRLYGHFVLGPTPLHYRYLLRCSGNLDKVEALELKNAVTGGQVEARRVTDLPASVEPFSVHPWDLPRRPPTQTVTFGPGVVEITTTRRFEPEVSVVFAPGTTVKLGPDASLLCFGKVTAVGTAAAPIVFEPLLADKPWGIMLLHGIGTAGSRMSYCRWHGGSVATHDLMYRSGMVSVLDTRDIVLDNSWVGRNHVGDDSMHWGYVAEGFIRNCQFDGARMDALDIDICDGLVISDCRFANSGNDCLDLMTAKVTVRGCRFDQSGDKGISVGESSRLDLTDSRFVGCVKGLEVKDESVLNIDDSTTIDDCTIGINLYRKNERYGVGGTLAAKSLVIRNSKEVAVKWDKRSTVPANLGEMLRQGGGT